MKRTIIPAITLILMSICLTACVTEKTRSTILSKLESNDIIQDDWEYLDYDVQDASPIPDIFRYNYYYEDADDIIYKVAIEGSVSKNDEHDLYYPVTVYNNLEAYETEETYTDSKTDTTKTRTVTKYKETDTSTSVRYRAYKHEFLFFFTIWDIEEA